MNNKLRKELVSLIKSLNGSLIAVSIEDERIIDEILKNDKINQSYSLSKNRKDRKEDSVDVTINQIGKKIKVKFNYMICDINGINTYLWKMINQSYKIINQTVIFYGISDDYDISKIIKRYERYNAKVKKIQFDDNYLLIIDVDKLKIKFGSKIKNNIKDVLLNINDAIGNGLMQ